MNSPKKLQKGQVEELSRDRLQTEYNETSLSGENDEDGRTSHLAAWAADDRALFRGIDMPQLG